MKQITSEPNWDTDGGVPISADVWVRVAQFVRALPTISPFISPCGDGSVHVRWTVEGRSFTVEVAESELQWMFRDSDGRRSYGQADDVRHVEALLNSHLMDGRRELGLRQGGRNQERPDLK